MLCLRSKRQSKTRARTANRREGCRRKKQKGDEGKIQHCLSYCLRGTAVHKISGNSFPPKKNGPDISMTYVNDKSCNNFVSMISKVMIEELASEICEENYISIMIDGATDISGKENETVHCRFVKDGQPVNRLGYTVQGSSSCSCPR